jgi:hypothetical protein
MEDLEVCFDRWGVRQWAVRPLREPDKRAHYNDEPLVTVTYEVNGREVVLKMGKHPYYYQNLRVVYMAIDAVRMDEERGLTELVRDAMALGAPPSGEREPIRVLGLRPGATAADIDLAYKVLANRWHPDKEGGNEVEFKAVQAAYDVLKMRPR